MGMCSRSHIMWSLDSSSLVAAYGAYSNRFLLNLHISAVHLNYDCHFLATDRCLPCLAGLILTIMAAWVQTGESSGDVSREKHSKPRPIVRTPAKGLDPIANLSIS